MNIKFSVIIPLYNKKKYIRKAIDSVLNQSYQNFEIIVANDGSTDDGDKEVLALHNDRIKLISQKNSGVSAARNLGIDNSSSEYLVFLDADDTWEPEFLNELYSLIVKYPDMGIYATNNYFIYSDNQKKHQVYSGLFKEQSQGVIENYFEIFAKYRKSPFSNSNYCVPRKILDDVGKYLVGVKLTEDSDLWCRIALKYKIAYSIKPLANYYLDTEGNTHTVFFPEDFQVTKRLKNALQNNLVKKEHLKSVKDLICVQEFYTIKRAITSNNKSFALKKLFNKNLFLQDRITFISCLIAILIPQFFFRHLSSLRNLFR